MKKYNEQIMNDPNFPKMESGYTVPEGYFESFSERLKLRMQTESMIQPHTKTIGGFIIYLKPVLGLAAAIAIIITVYLYPSEKNLPASFSKTQNTAVLSVDDPSDVVPLPNGFAYMVTEGQFFSALIDMDDYDDAKLSKEVLVDYLASNCSDFEILNAN